MHRTAKVALWLLVMAAGPVTAEEAKFSLPQGAHAFAATLGSQCLSDEHATIVANDRIVTVNDRPACAREIREIAENWVVFASEPIVTFTGTPEGLTAIRERLEQRFGKSPNRSLHFLAHTQACRCLAFVGKRRDEAAAMVAGLLPPAAKDLTTKAAVAADPFRRLLPGEKSPLETPSQDLIKSSGSTSITPPSA